MIVSHKYKYIFLKTRKTAGTSIEIALSMQCGQRDLITSVIDEEDLRVQLGGRGKQNYHWPVHRWTWQDLRVLREKRWLPAAYHHIPAAEARRHLPTRVWNTYFKFAVTRNPWDAVVSQFHWRRSQGDTLTLSQHIASNHAQVLAGNFDIFSINDHIIADKVCRYESLNDDLAEIAPQIGLDLNTLPRAKAGLHPTDSSHEEKFSIEDGRRVSNLFERDIAEFGYTLPPRLSM